MIRPTRAGLGVLIAIVGLFAIGRLLGLLELYVLGAMSLLAVVTTAGYVLLSRLDLAVARVASPAKLRVNSDARVDLSIENRTRRRTPVLSVYDRIGDGRGTSVLIAPLLAGTGAGMAYRLPTARRGTIQVGPLDVSISDPLGLFRNQTRAAKELQLTVLPHLVPLLPFSATIGQDPTPDHRARRSFAVSGDDFFALRPYVIGDELRRVNWRASARRDELVVRQEERPRTGLVTIILDIDRSSYFSGSPKEDELSESFERAVTAATSTLHAAYAGGDSVQFITTDGELVRTISTPASVHAVDEQLALVQPTADASVSQTLGDLRRSAKGGTLIVITSELRDETSSALAAIERAYGFLCVISCSPASSTASPPYPTLAYAQNGDLERQWGALVAAMTAAAKAPPTRVVG